MKVLFIEWCADDVLGGTANMEPLVELAYRRIIDLIYSTEDNLLDNDALQYATKTGAKWKQIREQLINVYQKIYIEDGYIRNGKCAEKLAKSRVNIEQKRTAQAAMIKKRNSLKEQETPLAAASAAATAPDVANQEPNNQVVKEKKKNTKKEKEFSEKFREFWEIYPRHRRGNRDGAWGAWVKAIEQERADENEMLEGAKSYAKSEWGQGEFAKGAAAWLNDDRWNYEVKLEDYKHQQQIWPEWKHKLASGIGKSNVASWFNDADFEDGVIYTKKQFQAENIRTRFLVEIEKTFGKPFQIVVRA